MASGWLAPYFILWSPLLPEPLQSLPQQEALIRWLLSSKTVTDKLLSFANIPGIVLYEQKTNQKSHLPLKILTSPGVPRMKAIIQAIIIIIFYYYICWIIVIIQQLLLHLFALTKEVGLHYHVKEI